MSIRFLIAAAAVVAVPIAAMGQETARKAEPEKRTCDSDVETGSRLSRVRRCRTKAERQAHKQEARQTVDRIQALKVTFGK